MTGAEILLDRFDALIDTPEAVERLRRFVLDLAVRGKLVAQDPANEPAEVLLQRIAEEKRRRYEAGEISKPKKLKPVRVAEQPFEIPAEWAWARFGQVAEIASNLEDPTLSPDLPHVAPNHIEKDTGRLLPYGTIGEDGVTSNKHRFYPGQILYSKIRPNLNKAVIVDFEGLCSADMYPLEPYVDTAYLHRFILSASFVRQVVSDDNRLAMPKVNQTQLQSVAVAVPPLGEQRRIVARVDELMALCDRLADGLTHRDALRQRWAASTVRHVTGGEPIGGAPAWSFAEAHLDTLLADPEAVPLVRRMVLDLAVRGRLTEQDPSDEPAEALLQRIAEEKRQRYEAGGIRKPKKLKPVDQGEQPFEIPTTWAWTRLGLIGEIVGGGTPKSKEPSYWSDEGVPWLTPADLNGHMGRRIARGRRDISEAGLNNSSAQLLPPESVLFSSRAPIGYVAIADVPLATNQGFKSVVPYVGGMTEYLYYFLLQAGPGIDAAASGTTFREVSGKVVSRVPVSLPPVEEQQRIVARLDAIMALCDRMADQLNASLETAKRVLDEALLDT